MSEEKLPRQLHLAIFLFANCRLQIAHSFSMQELDLTVSPQQASDEAALKKIILSSLGKNATHFSSYRIIRRSIDARSRNVKINLRAQIFFKEEIPASLIPA